MQTLPGEADDVSLLSGRQRFPLRKYAYALLLLLLLPVLLLVSAPVTAQLIVDSSELTVGLCEVSDPAADSAQVVCAVTARVPSLPMRVTADGTTARASRSAGGTSLGTLTVPAVDFGYGGDVALTLGGEMRVTSLQALREFAAEAQASEEVSLRLEAPLLLRFGLMLSLPVTLRKWLPLRGAQSFPNHILSVDISDADPGGGRERFPGTRLPNVISLTAEVRNPSSFALRPLGALNLSVHTPDGALVGRLSSNASAPLLLPSGASVQRLRGVLVAEKEAGLEAASRLLSDHLSGRPSHLYGVVESVSTPLYDSLFAGMRLHTTLPGLQAPLLDRVEVVVDSRRLVDWANPLDGRPLVLDAYLAISNPLAASFAVMRIDSHIFYNDQRVGRALPAPVPTSQPLAAQAGRADAARARRLRPRVRRTPRRARPRPDRRQPAPAACHWQAVPVHRRGLARHNQPDADRDAAARHRHRRRTLRAQNRQRRLLHHHQLRPARRLGGAPPRAALPARAARRALLLRGAQRLLQSRVGGDDGAGPGQNCLLRVASPVTRRRERAGEGASGGGRRRLCVRVCECERVVESTEWSGASRWCDAEGARR
uniref:Uncharacterized protein n=1 Tax=Emiliania huxleyi TaxID=2903 RepID=A0A7S3WS95_EMIHU|mmetsp:Transcript_28893/g.85263  ORF Transcript_28893/g.85263 Transcript_28893/m.85263 type:complete len:599 (-) Transcript_28893:103-1899(-)